MNAHDAEKAVLGAILSGWQNIDELGLRGADFAEPKDEAVFDACVRVANAGNRPDPISVRMAIGNHPSFGPIDVGIYLHELTQAVPLVASAGYYASLVGDAADRRALHAYADGVHQLAESDSDASDLIERARSMLDKAPSRKASDVQRWGDLLPQLTDTLERPTQRGIPTPWDDLNNTFYGLNPGWLYLVAARPAVGKSVFASNLAVHVAKTLNKPAIFVSLEMSSEDLGFRIIADQCSIPLQDILNRRMTDDQWAAYSSAVSEQADWPLFVVDDANLSMAQIRASVRSLARRQELGVVVVDYLQLIRPNPKVQREQQVAEISRALKVLARDLKVPVVALTQLNRGPEQRTDKKPQLHDLRESGAQEQDADVVILLSKQEETPWERTVFVAKNRQGQQREVTLEFWGHYSRMCNSGTSSGRWSPSSSIGASA